MSEQNLHYMTGELAIAAVGKASKACARASRVATLKTVQVETNVVPWFDLRLVTDDHISLFFVDKPNI
jgi:hypothetical protein